MVLVIIYSVGLLFDRGMFFANVVPTFTKKLLDLSEITWPSSVILSLHLSLEFIGLYFLLLMTVLITCHDFFTLDLCSDNKS